MQNNELEAKMEEIREIVKKYAKAKSDVVHLDHGRKILLSTLMKQHLISPGGKELSVNAQDREARADPEYVAHIDKLKEAHYDEVIGRWELKLVEMKFERWKTNMYAQAKEYKQYGNKN
tara:strand:- start:23 stop:379 length:357 start_codon:yes stop_codon:yes gene_type:complete